jgi:hypothetical protein
MDKPRNRKSDELAHESQQQRFVGWELYQENLRSGMDEQTATRQALLKVLPRGTKGSDNRAKELAQWKKYKLWPPPEIRDSDGTESPANKTNDADIQSAANTNQEPSENEIIRCAKEILMRNIDVAERPTTAKGRPSTLPTIMVAARFPSDLVAQLEALGGRKSHHLEKALKLYLKIVK